MNDNFACRLAMNVIVHNNWYERQQDISSTQKPRRRQAAKSFTSVTVDTMKTTLPAGWLWK